jgi:hydrogenase maturation protease
MRPLLEILGNSLEGRVMVVGLGEAEAGDDGAGVRLVRALQRRGRRRTLGAAERVYCLEAGTTPERYLGVIERGRFDHVVLVDAVDFGQAAGSVGWWAAEDIRARHPQVSTHRMSLGLLAQVWTADGRTRVWLLGVQPGTLRRGTGLSRPVARTCGGLLRLLREVGRN